MYKFKYPSLISVFVTNNCNLNCRHCCFDSGNKVGNELDTTDIITVLDKIVETGIVCLDFSGGEPFLRGDLLDLVEYSFENGIQSISIATNALCITEEQMTRLKSIQDRFHLLFLRLSLDGASKETHEWIRGANTFEPTLEKFKELKNRGINLRELNTVVSKMNYHELTDIVQIAKSFRIKTSVFLPLIPVGRAENINKYMVSIDEWKQLCIDKSSMESKYGIEIFADSPVSSTLDEKKINSSLPCMCGYQFLGIRPNGDYSVCPIVSDGGEGNIFELSIEEYWRDSKLLNDIRNIDKLEGKCSMCRYKNLCRGGCRGLAYCISNSWLKPDPLCWINV